jgi:hypothetical protein
MSMGDNYNSDLVNKAYLIAHKAGSGGRLSRIELAERLTREGIPADLADQAAMDILQEVVKRRRREGKRQLLSGLFIFTFGVIAMAISAVVLDYSVVIPFGIIGFGVVLMIIDFSGSRQNDL